MPQVRFPLKMDCSDTRSTWGFVIEYGGNRGKVEGFVSDGATPGALRTDRNAAEGGIDIRTSPATAGPGSSASTSGSTSPTRRGMSRTWSVTAPGATRCGAIVSELSRIGRWRSWRCIRLQLTALRWAGRRWSNVPRGRCQCNNGGDLGRGLDPMRTTSKKRQRPDGLRRRRLALQQPLIPSFLLQGKFVHFHIAILTPHIHRRQGSERPPPESSPWRRRHIGVFV